MPPEWAEFVQNWGYWFMAFGSLLEGETFLIIAGIASSNGLLHMYWLIGLATAGAMVHDVTLFSVSRFGGRRILNKLPKLKSKVEIVTNKVERLDYWLILFFRFGYGIRVIIPIAIGLTRIPMGKFVLFGFLGALIWSTTFIIAGYFFGHALIYLLNQFDVIDFIEAHWIIALITLIVVAFGVYFIVTRIIKSHEQKEHDSLKD